MGSKENDTKKTRSFRAVSVPHSHLSLTHSLTFLPSFAFRLARSLSRSLSFSLAQRVARVCPRARKTCTYLPSVSSRNPTESMFYLAEFGT